VCVCVWGGGENIKFLAKISYAWGFPCSFLQEDDLEYQIAGRSCFSVINNFLLIESRV